MNSRTFYAYASTNRIDMFIKRLHCHLSAFTRDARNILNNDYSFMNLRNLLLKKALEEERRRTAQDNLRVLILIVNLHDYTTNRIAFAIIIRGNLVLLRQIELIAILIKKQHLTLPYLIQFTGDNMSEHIRIAEI